ncbi:MAG: transporter [Frankiaceae bacterium]|nr:transporter [Frankiaceae bacterium]
MAKKRPVLLIAVIGAILAVVRRRKAGRTEADLWREATSAPDLR